MCGIIGIIEPSQNFKTIKELQEFIEKGFILNRHRGTDSYGSIIFLRNDKYIIIKGLTLEKWKEKFLEKLKDIDLENILLIINHHRKATVGKITIKLQHPVIVESNNKKSRVYVIQNGTKEELQKIVLEELELDIEKDKEKIEKISDTWSIGYIYNTLKPYKSNIHFYAMVNFLKKTGVVFIYDKQRKLIFFHKDGSRQLWYSKKLKIFASEPIDKGYWYKFKNIDWYGDIYSFIEEIEKSLIEKKSKKEFIKTICKYCNNEFIKEKYDTYVFCKLCRNSITYTYTPITSKTKKTNNKKELKKSKNKTKENNIKSISTATVKDVKKEKIKKIVNKVIDFFEKRYKNYYHDRHLFNFYKYTYGEPISEKYILKLIDKTPTSYLLYLIINRIKENRNLIIKNLKNKDIENITYNDVIDEIKKLFTSQYLIYLLETYFTIHIGENELVIN